MRKSSRFSLTIILGFCLLFIGSVNAFNSFESDSSPPTLNDQISVDNLSSTVDFELSEVYFVVSQVFDEDVGEYYQNYTLIESNQESLSIKSFVLPSRFIRYQDSLFAEDYKQNNNTEIKDFDNSVYGEYSQRLLKVPWISSESEEYKENGNSDLAVQKI